LSTLNTVIARYVDDIAPDSVLLLGSTANARWVQLDLNCAPNVVSVREVDQSHLPSATGPFDLVLVAGVIEHLDRRVGGRLLGTLRDLHARTLIVQILSAIGTDETCWSLADMLAFGFDQLGSFEESEGTVDVYRFSLNDYKKTPDWLNPNHWAHPHLWKP